MNTSIPNRVIKLALEQQLFPEFGNSEQVRVEVAYGQEKSRIDFLLSGAKPIYIEVKSTTRTQGTLYFPTRGQHADKSTFEN